MSTPSEELRAVREAWQLLLDIGGGQEKRIPSATREKARNAVKHFPYPAVVEATYEKAGRRDLTRIREGALSAERTPTRPPEKARLVPLEPPPTPNLGRGEVGRERHTPTRPAPDRLRMGPGE